MESSHAGVWLSRANQVRASIHGRPVDHVDVHVPAGRDCPGGRHSDAFAVSDLIQ